MGSQDKTRAQLLEELSVMKQRVDELLMLRSVCSLFYLFAHE
jgi:hypothetical protein